MFPTKSVMSYLKALYPLGLLLTVVPLVDWAVKTYPFSPGVLQWRFGAELSLIASLGIMLTGFGVLGLIAAFCGQRIMLRLLSVTAAIGAALTAVLLVVFLLDAVQIRDGVTDGNLRSGIAKGLISGAATTLMSTIALAALMVGLWRAAGGAHEGTRTADPVIVRSQNSLAPSTQTPSTSLPTR